MIIIYVLGYFNSSAWCCYKGKPLYKFLSQVLWNALIIFFRDFIDVGELKWLWMLWSLRNFYTWIGFLVWIVTRTSVFCKNYTLSSTCFMCYLHLLLVCIWSTSVNFCSRYVLLFEYVKFVKLCLPLTVWTHILVIIGHNKLSWGSFWISWAYICWCHVQMKGCV